MASTASKFTDKQLNTWNRCQLTCRIKSRLCDEQKDYQIKSSPSCIFHAIKFVFAAQTQLIRTERAD